MPPKRCTAPKQQEAPLDSSPPRFTFHRAVPASQRFTRRPATASKEIAFSATAGHSDEEEAAKANTNSRSSKQTATRAGQSAVRTTAKKAVSSKTAAAATARRPAPKKSAPSAAAEDEEREANAAEQPSDERKEEEEEEKERVQSKRLTGKKQTAVKPTAPVAVAARSKKAAVVATRQRNKHTAAADGEQMDGHEKGMQTAAQRKVAQPKKDARAQGSKQPPAVQKSKQQQSGGKRAAGNHAAANNEQLSSMQHDEGAEEERTNSRTVLPSEEKKQDALTLLEAFNGDIALPELDVTAGRPSSGRSAPLDKEQPAAPSRNRRAAKHVASGLSATTELYYNAEQAGSKAPHAAPAETSAESAADGAAEEAVQPAESEQPLRDVVLLVSTKPQVSQQYEGVAKSLGARVVKRVSAAVTHVVWDDGDDKVLTQVARMGDNKPSLVSPEWLLTTSSNIERAFEPAYPINEDRPTDAAEQKPTMATDDGGVTASPHIECNEPSDSQRQQPLEVERKYDDNESGEGVQTAMADVAAATAQQLNVNDAAGSNGDTATGLQAESTASAAETEELRPGWQRKRTNKSSWADDSTTTTITQFERDKLAEDRERLADEKGVELGDDQIDADLVADNESAWIDTDGEEGRRERKKAGRRFECELQRSTKAQQQQQPAAHKNHNHALNALGMVEFLPSTFDEAAIDDRSERHALLSPLTEDEDESATESGSSSEFECSDDEDSSGGEPSSSSDDQEMAALVDDRYDERRALRKKKLQRYKQKMSSKKRKPTKVVKGASRGARVHASKRDRWEDEESDSEEELVMNQEAVPLHIPRLRPHAAARENEHTAQPRKKPRPSVPHVVAAPPPATRPLCFAISALPAEKAKLVKIASRLRGATVQDDQEDDVASHVLVAPNDKPAVRTRKVLFGIARGSWILDRQWLLEYVDAEMRLVVPVEPDGLAEPEADEVKYETTHWPGAQRSRLLRRQSGQSSLVFAPGDKVFVADRTALPRSLVEQLVYMVGGQPVADFFQAALCLCADDFLVGDLGDWAERVPRGAFDGRDIVTTEWLYDSISIGGREAYDGYRRWTHPELSKEEEAIGGELGSPAL